MNTKKISYSKLLIEFIEPVLSGEEDEYEYLGMLNLGKLAWNFSVSDLNNLPFDDIHKDAFLKITQSNIVLNEVFNKLVLRKYTKYSQYNQFIFEVSTRINKSGEKVIHVESVPADKIGKT